MNSEFILFAMINYKVTEGATTLPIAQVKGLKNTCLMVYSTVLSTAISSGITNLESSKDSLTHRRGENATAQYLGGFVLKISGHRTDRASL